MLVMNSCFYTKLCLVNIIFILEKYAILKQTGTVFNNNNKNRISLKEVECTYDTNEG